MTKREREQVAELYRCAADACITLPPDDMVTVPSEVARAACRVSDGLLWAVHKLSLEVAKGREVAANREHYIDVCLEAAAHPMHLPRRHGGRAHLPSLGDAGNPRGGAVSARDGTERASGGGPQARPAALRARERRRESGDVSGGDDVRDPARIDRMLAKLGELWKRYPDQRLGQLVVNLAGLGPQQPWHIDDDAWEQRLDRALAEGL